MATPTTDTTPKLDVPAALGQLAWIATLLTAIILSAVLLGNLALLGLGASPVAWLVLLVDLGPVVATLLGNVATYLGYYGTWRILRGLDRYDVRGDAKNQALQNVPGMLQDVPAILRARMGCARLLTLGALASSLLVMGLTLAPPPLRVLGYHGSAVVATLTPTATATVPNAIGFSARLSSNIVPCGADDSLAPISLSLANSSAKAIGWEILIRDSVPGSGVPWANADPFSGTLAAGGAATVMLVADDGLCAALAASPTSQNFTAQVALTNGSAATFTLVVTVVPPPTPTPSPTATPVVVFSVSPKDNTQYCNNPPPYTVTLDNTGSNGAVSWQFSADQQLQDGSPWASADPASGTISAGQTATFMLTPNGAVCTTGGKYTATITVTPGGTGPYQISDDFFFAPG